MFFKGFSFLGPVHTFQGSGWFEGASVIGGFNHQTNQYFACAPLESCASWHTSYYELVAHILISKGRSQIDQILRMARTFSRKQVSDNFFGDSTWVSTYDNMLSDVLSRFDDPEAFSTFFGHYAY